MARLIFVDASGGSLAALGAAMARVEGAPGFDEAVARAEGDVQVDPTIQTVLAEVGVLLVPAVKTFDPKAHPLSEGDVIIGLGAASPPGAAESWPLELAPEGAPPLVQRSSARIARDAIGRKLAAFCAGRSAS